MSLHVFDTDPDTHLSVLANGVRVVVIRLPHLETASVSVFVRAGSGHESRRLSGISHFVEHMAFKGTEARSCQQINLDAERLGADVNAHTDKDHTGFHMRGRARDAGRFIGMLADIVQHGTFPAEELERERQVLLQEFLEDDEDPMAAANRLFDKLCFGDHPLAQSVIGLRGNLRRFTRDDLLGWVGRLYSGANVVVGVAGNVDPGAMVEAAAAAFGALEPGSVNRVEPAGWVGGSAARALAGCGQTHIVLGLPLPALADPRHAAGQVAAALFGEGMSSPLLDEIRERRGLAYYVSCSADVTALAGQFVVEASTAPEHALEFLVETKRLLAVQAGAIDPVDLERARNQLAVRRLRDREHPSRRLEDAALDVLAFDRVRPQLEIAALAEAVDADAVRGTFAAMLAAPAAVAIAGKVSKGAPERMRELFAAPAPARAGGAALRARVTRPH
jgi:predicted Zn-dependent peptidase